MTSKFYPGGDCPPKSTKMWMTFLKPCFPYFPCTNSLKSSMTIFIDNFSKFPPKIPDCHLSCLVNRGEEESEDNHDHQALHSVPQHCLYLTEQASQQFIRWTSSHCLSVFCVTGLIIYQNQTYITVWGPGTDWYDIRTSAATILQYWILTYYCTCYVLHHYMLGCNLSCCINTTQHSQI